MNQQPARLRLLDQVSAHRDGIVTTIQRWSGFSRNRHALIVVSNGTVTTRRVGSAGPIRDWCDAALRQVAGHVITDTRMWELLTALGVARPVCHLDLCGAPLPAGGLFCAACGATQPAAVPA